MLNFFIAILVIAFFREHVSYPALSQYRRIEERHARGQHSSRFILFCAALFFAFSSQAHATPPALSPRKDKLALRQPYTISNLFTYVPGTGLEGQPLIGVAIIFDDSSEVIFTGGQRTLVGNAWAYSVAGSYYIQSGTPSWSSGTATFKSATVLSGHLQYTYLKDPTDPRSGWVVSDPVTYSFDLTGTEPPVDPAKNLGTDPSEGCGCNRDVANPINSATGNKYQPEVDFQGTTTAPGLTRYYNSLDPGGSEFGKKWRSNWHRSLSIAPSATKVTVTQEGGRQIIFNKSSGGAYVATPDVTSRLTTAANGWRLVREDDATEFYDSSGRLISITTRSQRVTMLTYDFDNHLTRVTGPFGHQLNFTYDPVGRVSQMTASDGGVFTYAYGTSGNLISVTYPGGAVRQYRYENAAFVNALTGIVDELGVRFASYGYDVKGRAVSSQHAGGAEKTTLTFNADGTTSVTDARGNTHTFGFITQFGQVKGGAVSGAPDPKSGGSAFAYNSAGFLSLRADWNGNVTSYTRDGRGNETSRVEAAGTALARRINTSWHPTFHLPTQIAEQGGRTTDFTYDDKGNLLTKTITAGTPTRTYSYTYSVLGQVLSATDPRGNVSTYTYDAEGNLASTTNALGHVTSFTSYDGAGRLLRKVDPNGVVMTFAYDPRGRLLSKTEAALTWHYAYDAAGNLIRVTNPDTSFLVFAYDAAHRLIRIADAGGNHLDYSLDATSNVILERVFDPTNLKRFRSFVYDSVDRLIQAKDAQGQITSYTYDGEGDLTSQIDPLGHAHQYVYDALNRLARATDPNRGATVYSYDALDHLTSVTDPRGLRTNYAWTALDDTRTIASPDTGNTVRTFDAAGNVLSSIDARGKTTTYVYDALNRIKSETFSDGAIIVRQYDQGVNGKGRLTGFTDATGSTSYNYDANGHVTRKQQVIGGVARTTTYAYDPGGRLANITYPSGKQITYAYDAVGRVLGLKIGAQTVVGGVTYAPFSGVSGWTFGNGGAYRRTIDANNRIAGLIVPGGRSIVFTFDAANRITAMTDTVLPSKTFGYDALDRLTNFAGGTLNQTYGYDADGNRIYAALQDEVSFNQLTYSYGSTNNRLLNISGGLNETFAYTASGATATHSTAAADYTFAYDPRGRLVKSTLGALAETYAINGLGQRVFKSDPTKTNAKTLFAYDETGHLIGEYDATGNLVEETVWLGDLPVATLRSTGSFFIAPDHLGAPAQITNASRQVVWTWDHDPFGNGAPTATGSFTYNLRFPGQYFDAETGLHYNYFRDYDPKLGRYIESDPIGLHGGVNTYAYVGSSPVSAIDPLGEAGPGPAVLLALDPLEEASPSPWALYMANKNAKLKPPKKGEGMCARYVMSALRGTSPSSAGFKSAKDAGPHLLLMGFEEVTNSSYKPKLGDVVVFDAVPSSVAGSGLRIVIHGAHPDGHIQIWDGQNWISDFRQRAPFLPGSDYFTGTYKIYRYPGGLSPPPSPDQFDPGRS